jgi:hypothetical protein
MAKKPTAPKQIEFTVIKANIADEDGNKVLIGSTVKLGKKMAEHYRKLGYIEMPLPDYGDDNEPDDVHGTSDAGEAEDAGAAEGEAAPESASAKEEASAGDAPKRRRL